jgi:hypothetical protein
MGLSIDGVAFSVEPACLPPAQYRRDQFGMPGHDAAQLTPCAFVLGQRDAVEGLMALGRSGPSLVRDQNRLKMVAAQLRRNSLLLPEAPPAIFSRLFRPKK